MRRIVSAIMLAVAALSGPVVYAQDCEASAADMKLKGAAKNSFMQKCERDSGCEAKAAEKKLSGAAKNSFVKKCVTDAKADKK